MDDSGLLDSRVLVIGGTSGIGLATARRAAGSGANVTIASRSPDKVDAARAEIGERASGRCLDMRDADAVLHFFADEAPFDHIVVSGADLVLGSVSNLALGDAYEAMRSKFWGAYHVARFARLTSHGSLTLVSGAASRRPNPQVPLIGAINAALESLAAGLAMEMAPRRVNAVSPGRIDTPFWRFLDPDEQEKLRERTASALPVGIVGLADHVAIQVIACMRNPYMTGSTVIVDGGYSIA